MAVARFYNEETEQYEKFFGGGGAGATKLEQLKTNTTKEKEYIGDNDYLILIDSEDSGKIKKLKSADGGFASGTQSNWTQTDSTKLDYIKNKPNIITAIKIDDTDYTPDASGKVTLDIQSGGVNIVQLTKAEYDALAAAGQLDANTLYDVTDE